MADGTKPTSPQKVQYRWPFFVLAAVLLAIVLAVVWLSFEIRRTERIRRINTPGQSLGPGP